MASTSAAPAVGDNATTRTDVQHRLVPAACGVAYGLFTYWVEALSGCPAWYEVWHGVVPWAMLTIAIAWRIGGSLHNAAAVGLAVQLGLVIGYYGVRTIDIEYVGWRQVGPYALMAVLVGPLYGIAGTWLRDPASRGQLATVVLVGAPFAIDGINLLRETVDPEWTASHHLGALWTVTVSTLAIGAIVVCALAGSWRDRLIAATACTAIGYLFSLVSFYYIG